MKFEKSSIGIGLLGMGVVGTGVAERLTVNGDLLERNVGLPLVLRKVLVKDTQKMRSISISDDMVTDDIDMILNDKEIDVVIELIGGDETARDYIRRALQMGKHVITANKDVIAKYGIDLSQIAYEKGVRLLFEGAVGGAIPIVGPLMKDLLANRIYSIHAIINGTTNFILTRMACDHMDFDTALDLAQKKGYAEANFHNDIEGIDSAYKLAILATLSFHGRIDPKDIYTEGISSLQERDFRYASELGYAIKLLAIAKLHDDGVEVRVHPALVPEIHLLAKIDDVYNAVEVEGDLIGRAVFHGLGAGREPTTSAVIGDLIELGVDLANNTNSPKLINGKTTYCIKPMSDLVTSYYLRMSVVDMPGVLAQITQVLGNSNIGIASVIQKDSDPGHQSAEIVITTHPSKEEEIQKSLTLLEQLDVVRRIDNLIRVEEWPTYEG